VEHQGKQYVSPTETGSHGAFINAHLFNKARFSLGEEVSPEQRDDASRLISEIFAQPGGRTIEEIDKALSSAINEHLEDCNRLATVAKTLALPVEKALSDLGNSMKEILSAPSRSRRILTFLDPKWKSTVKEQIPLLLKLVEFEKRGNIETYRNMRTFSSDIAPQLDDEKFGAPHRYLAQALRTEDFIDRWPEIVSAYENLRIGYVSIYTSKHRERSELVEKAIESIKAHPQMKKMKEEEAEQLLAQLKSLYCEVKDPKEIGEYPFVCEKCGSSLKDINHNLEIIELRRSEVRRRLDEELAKEGKIPDVVIGFSVKKKITSDKQMSELIGRMKEVSDKAFEKKKSVSVNLDLEVGDG
jgi:hypothetical protein